MDKAAIEKYLDDLATMDELDYAQARKKASDVLRINMGVLDKLVAKRRKKMTVDASPMFLKPVEPWPDTVDGAALLDDLWSMLKRHVVLPKFAGDAIVMHAHAHDAARHSPILFASSPSLERQITLRAADSPLEQITPRVGLLLVAFLSAFHRRHSPFSGRSGALLHPRPPLRRVPVDFLDCVGVCFCAFKSHTFKSWTQKTKPTFRWLA